MFLERLDRVRKTVGFRLTAGFAMLFAVSTLGLFVLAYVLLAGSLRQRDRLAVRTELVELAGDYDRGGLAALQEETRAARADPGAPRLFIRLSTPENQTLFEDPPAARSGFDVAALEGTPRPRDGEWRIFSAHDDEDQLELLARSLGDGNVLQVGASTAAREEVLERFRTIFGLILLPVLLFGFVGGVLFARRALRPVRSLGSAVRAITRTGDVSQRIPPHGTGDELDELVRLFNDMLVRIEQLIQGMREALDNVAHDLRTPLTRLRSAAEQALQAAPDPAAYREALADCLEESEKVVTMLGTLMDVAEAEAGTVRLHRQPVLLRELLADVADLYAFVAEEKGVSLHLDVRDDARVTVDRSRMRQVFANLIDNAVKFTPPGGRVEIDASEEERGVTVRVRDTGAGIRPGDLPHIWERLYRGDPSRSEHGFGLGLSLVKAIVAAHGGRVDVESRPGAGAVFSVHLPDGRAEEGAGSADA